MFDEDIDHKGRDVPRGSLPVLSTNRNKLGEQWKRYEDCHDLLTGWIAGDLNAALKRQAERLYLVEQVEQMRADGETVENTFAELEDWFGEASYTLRRQYKKLTKPKHRMGVAIPIALVQRDGAYVIESRAVDTTAVT